MLFVQNGGCRNYMAGKMCPTVRETGLIKSDLEDLRICRLLKHQLENISVESEGCKDKDEVMLP